MTAVSGRGQPRMRPSDWGGSTVRVSRGGVSPNAAGNHLGPGDVSQDALIARDHLIGR